MGLTRNGAPESDSTADLTGVGREIVTEEVGLLSRVQDRIERAARQAPEQIEDLDAQLIELRDAIAEAKEEDVPSLIDQMHQVAAISRKRGQGRSIPIDPKNPYFGHLRLREARTRNQRDVLIGRHTLLDDGDGVTIVDWRNAPVSRLYYRYDEGDDYEEEFDDRTLAGEVVVRRSVAVHEGDLRRVASPQGTWAKDRSGRWREAVGSARPTLAGGSGTAIRVPRQQLGVHGDEDAPRADKHLQEITALIDPRQFELITRPESGVVLIQGGAGSGKTTVALHRVAYLAFQDAKRFHPSKMVVIVYGEGLVEYIRHVLPSLGVEGVNVTTYRRWSAHLIRRLRLPLPVARESSTPDVVARFKKHPVILRMIDELVREQLEDVRQQLQDKVGSRGDNSMAVGLWEELAGLSPVARVERMLDLLKGGRGRALAAGVRAAAETVLRTARDQVGAVLDDWFELNTNGARIRAAINQHAAADFSASEVDTIVRWCGRKAEIDTDVIADDESERTDGVAPDPEDDPILLRLVQLKRGGIFVGGRRLEYEHMVIDEAQDLCPLEVRVLLDCVTPERSVTIAGDKAQKMIFDNGFVDWRTLLADAGLPHTELEPLKITYRSTRQVMEFSRAVLGSDEQFVAWLASWLSFFLSPFVSSFRFRIIQVF